MSEASKGLKPEKETVKSIAMRLDEILHRSDVSEKTSLDISYCVQELLGLDETRPAPLTEDERGKVGEIAAGLYELANAASLHFDEPVPGNIRKGADELKAISEKAEPWSEEDPTEAGWYPCEILHVASGKKYYQPISFSADGYYPLTSEYEILRHGPRIDCNPPETKDKGVGCDASD